MNSRKKHLKKNMAPPPFPIPKNKQSSPKLYGFHTFAEPGCPPVTLNLAFRDSIRQFLQQCAEPQDYNVQGMHVWCTFLVHENRGIVLPLYTVEENVDNSETPFCDYCRCAGWSHNFVSKRKYHLIIPVDDEWNKPLDEGAFDLQTHLLHGLIHCNGFGHLICINGIEGGSKFICGTEVMDLWDRLSTTLQARQVTVEDLCKKHKMDLRLLHGVAYGRSWFGSWGYRFCLGSFGINEDEYESAINMLSSLELDQVTGEFTLANGLTPIKHIIRHYQELSENNLLTVRDLFRFMLVLKSRSLPPQKLASYTKVLSYSRTIQKCSVNDSTSFSLRNTSLEKEKSIKCKKFSSVAAKMDSRWPIRRLEHVAKVIVDALKEKRAANSFRSSGMTRQEARDAARIHIGDTGLIDHVLKAMNNVIVGNYIVRRAVNPSTKVLEYTIRDLNATKVVQFSRIVEPIKPLTKSKVVHFSRIAEPMEPLTMNIGSNVNDDIVYLYKKLLLGYLGNESSVNKAVQTILNSKHFVKEWPFRDESDNCLRFICRLTRSSIDLNIDFSRDFPPREYVVVPLYATVGDLKIAAQNAMRDTYCVMEMLEITDIVEMEGVNDSEVLFGLVESGRELWVRGFGLDFETELRYEGGSVNWTVKCKCGARDDDGERMVSCDICETWQHTRCIGIEDAGSVPRFFVCDACCSSIVPVDETRSSFDFSMGACEDSMLLLPGIHTGLLYCE